MCRILPPRPRGVRAGSHREENVYPVNYTVFPAWLMVLRGGRYRKAVPTVIIHQAARCSRQRALLFPDPEARGMGSKLVQQANWTCGINMLIFRPPGWLSGLQFFSSTPGIQIPLQGRPPGLSNLSSILPSDRPSAVKSASAPERGKAQT